MVRLGETSAYIAPAIGEVEDPVAVLLVRGVENRIKEMNPF